MFTMALASLSLSGSRWGWFVGGVAFLATGVVALRQYQDEEETEYEQPASGSFVLWAILVMLLAMLLMFWFFSNP
jgi:hypothetical protein